MFVPVDSATAWICWLNHCIAYHVLLFLIFSTNWWLFSLKLSIPVLNEWVDEKLYNLEILESVLGGAYFSPPPVFDVCWWQYQHDNWDPVLLLINDTLFIRICWNESFLLLKFWLLQGNFVKTAFAWYNTMGECFSYSWSYKYYRVLKV